MFVLSCMNVCSVGVCVLRAAWCVLGGVCMVGCVLCDACCVLHVVCGVVVVVRCYCVQHSLITTFITVHAFVPSRRRSDPHSHPSLVSGRVL